MNCLFTDTFQPVLGQVLQRWVKLGKNAPFGRMDDELLTIQASIYG